jgi:hypothetical protein
MDATDRIQKINAMSQELKKFGFSDDTSTAIEEARNICMSDDDVQNSQVFSKEDNALKELTNGFRRFKDITTNKVVEMGQVITELQNQIQGLKQEVSTLKQTRQTPQYEPRPSQSQTLEQNSVGNDANTEQNQETKPYNQRQGQFTPEDVKIENIFYYGQR